MNRAQQRAVAWTAKVEQTKHTYQQLIIAARDLNAARDELRATAERLAGCTPENWSFDDIGRYIELGHKSLKSLT